MEQVICLACQRKVGEHHWYPLVSLLVVLEEWLC